MTAVKILAKAEPVKVEQSVFYTLRREEQMHVHMQEI
jgi:hypothetical protein